MAGIGKKISEHTAKIRATIAAVAKKYGQKFVDVLLRVVMKYKDIIVDALKKDGKVVIEEGRRIVIKVINDVVKVIVDGIHVLGGKYEITSDEVEDEENGLKESKLHYSIIVDFLSLYADLSAFCMKIKFLDFQYISINYTIKRDKSLAPSLFNCLLTI